MEHAVITEQDLARYGLRPKFPEVIDSSMLKDFADCPQYFYLRHVLGLRKRFLVDEENAHLDWGTMWHKLLEVLIETDDPVQALSHLEQWPSSLVGENDRHGRTKERMIQIFFDYLERFRERDKKDYEDIRGEQYFDIFNSEFGIRWSGRIDLIRLYKRNGKIIVWDYKTTSRMGPHYFDLYEHSFQLPGYYWAASQLITEPIHELKLDVLYTLKASHDFHRRSIRYTPEQINEWASTVKRYLDNMYYLRDNHLYEPHMWNKNWNNCTRWGICTFADVCFTPPRSDTRFRILMEDYVEDRWDPKARS